MMHWLIELVMPVWRQGEVKERERENKEGGRGGKEEKGKMRKGRRRQEGAREVARGLPWGSSS